MQLENKVSLITGGGKGIGKAIALAFAREGSDVAIAARTEADLLQTASEVKQIGKQCLVIVTDLTDPSQVEKMVQETMDKFGQIDVLINNSGIEGPIMSVADMDLDGWHQTLSVNLTGAMLSAKHVLKSSMIPRESGNIVNITSIAGRKGSVNRSPYNSSKFGMIGFNQALAFEMGPMGIRVNCIAPGLVEGERIDRVINANRKGTGMTYDQTLAMINARVAMGRMVKPEEIASLAVFLASDQSSGITGQTINCCCGLEMD